MIRRVHQSIPRPQFLALQRALQISWEEVPPPSSPTQSSPSSPNSMPEKPQIADLLLLLNLPLQDLPQNAFEACACGLGGRHPDSLAASLRPSAAV